MCGANKRFIFYLPLALLFASAAAAPRAEEPGPWYLISETELRSIEQYRENSEREKRNWLSQASALRIRAEKSEADSSLLNSQLAEARAQNRKLETSFNGYAQDQLIKTSLKNGEIADLKEKAATEKQKATKAEGTAALRLVIIIVLAGVIVLYIAYKVLRFFRIIKIQ